MIFTIFTNITNFNLLLASVSIVCIELENNCYKSNKLKKYSVHPAKIKLQCSSHQCFLVCIELDNYFYKSNKIKKYSDHFSIISSYFNGLLFSASVV